MNEFIKPHEKKSNTQIEKAESADSKFCEELDKLEGDRNLQLRDQDPVCLVAQLIEAINDKDLVPDDLNSPDNQDDSEDINIYANRIYNIASEIIECAEAMMLGDEVKKNWEDKQDEEGNTRDHADEAGVSNGDF